MKKLSRGILVTIEGIDGCGKSTLLQQLIPLLHDFPVRFTKEPGATAFGTHVRTLIQQQQTPLDPKTEFLLFAADRAQHFFEIIIPALAQKKLIISDRMADSSVVYQGYVRKLDITIINQVNRWVMTNVTPDLTFFIEISIEEAVKRMRQRPEYRSTNTQQEQGSFWVMDPSTTNALEKARAGYHEIFKKRQNVITLDGRLAPEKLAAEAARYLDQWLKNNTIYE